MLDSLCSCSCIVPFWLKIFFFKGGDKEVEELLKVIESDEREDREIAIRQVSSLHFFCFIEKIICSGKYVEIRVSL